MKNSKKLLSLYLVIVMTLSMANGFVSKAADTITVLLRIEQDQATLTKPVQVTMTTDDIKSYGDLELATDTITPLHVLAKYLLTEQGATEDTLKDYLLLSSGYLYGISLNGTIKKDYGSPSVDPDIQDAYWMYAVNDASPVNSSTGYGYSMNEYPVQDNDEIVFYGIWGGDFTNGINPFYSSFDQKEYQTTEKEPIEVTLLGFDIYNDYAVKANRAMSGAHITVTNADGKQLDQDFVTDENGKVSLLFETAGTYTLSAYRKTADGAHFDISRPQATVTVKEQTAVPSATPSNKVITPGKVKKVNITVKKVKGKKRKLTITWKKTAKASGYQVWISKKKGKGYKKAATVNKTKKVLRKKKGTYYVKVRAYTKQIPDQSIVTGSFSKPKKIKVK